MYHTDEVEPFPEGSRRPDASGTMMSNSLLTYAYIKGKDYAHVCTHESTQKPNPPIITRLCLVFSADHSEMAALLFTSSVCIGLLLTLLALSVRVSCWWRRPRDHRPTPKCQRPVLSSWDDDHEKKASEDEDETESSLISATERKTINCWEEVTYVSEAAERAERIERRDMVIQEIWMNAWMNGSSC